MMPEPMKPTGDGPDARFMRWVWDTLRSFRPISSPTVKVTRTTMGVRFDAAASVSAQPSTPPQCYHIRGVFKDHLSCVTWDGVKEGATLVDVAKHPRFRRSYTNDIIDGVVFSFAYTHPTDPDNNRIKTTSTPTAGTQTECIDPRYVVYAAPADGYIPDGEIWAEQTNYAGVTVAGVKLTWLEISPQRVWVRRWNQQA